MSVIITFKHEASPSPTLPLTLRGRLDFTTASGVYRQIQARLKPSAIMHLVIDLTELDYIDDIGALILNDLQELMASRSGTCEVINVQPSVTRMLDLFGQQVEKLKTPVDRRKSPNAIVRLGAGFIKSVQDTHFIVSFLGDLALSLLAVIRRPWHLRFDETILQMQKTGVDALPIVGLISFLLGLIMAFMSALQLKQFGANVYVASLVALAMVSELGPIMTAIVVAGRSGSAFAAEIGTMKISEEIDALVIMGFDPVLFLAVPRVIAAAIVVPLLVIFSNLFAIIGGMLVGLFMLDLTPNTYLNATVKALSLFEIFWGLSKSLIFAFLIAWVGCVRGFEARGGASAVGNAATSAVVTSIFLIILVDSMMAVLRSYW